MARIIALHGEDFTDRVESEARLVPSFAKLLGDVWKNRMSEAILQRVQAVWDRSGWDGVPG
jgi:hypothetical protein